MKNSKTLAENLRNYSILAGSILTSSLTAHGQVVYTNIIPDKELGGVPPSSFPETETELLDLNNDGIFDFKISLSIYGTNAAADGYNFKEKMDNNGNLYNLVGTYTVEYRPFLVKLDCNDSVPLNNNFYGFFYGNFAYQFPVAVAYNWQNVHDKYVGLKFKVGDDFHYGWIRFDVNTADSVPNLIMKDYAYEETANKKIAVCDTGFAVSVGSPENGHGLSIYPNPSHGKSIIKLDQSLTGNVDLSVKDALGNQLYQTTLQSSAYRREIPVDLSHLPSGVYFIQLKTAAASITERWMKL